jgi:hypothetical protein
MSPNNELDRERLMKAIENSTILPHHRAAGQGKAEATFEPPGKEDKGGKPTRRKRTLPRRSHSPPVPSRTA